VTLEEARFCPANRVRERKQIFRKLLLCDKGAFTARKLHVANQASDERWKPWFDEGVYIRMASVSDRSIHPQHLVGLHGDPPAWMLKRKVDGFFGRFLQARSVFRLKPEERSEGDAQFV